MSKRLSQSDKKLFWNMSIENSHKTPYVQKGCELAEKFKGNQRVIEMFKLFDSSKKLWHLDKGFKVACEKGCAYCCHLHVELYKDEAMYLVKQIREKFDQPDIDNIKQRATQKWAIKEKMPNKDRLLNRTPCPLLNKNSNSCSMYDARPLGCRLFYSCDITKCEDGYLRPEGNQTNAFWAGPFMIGHDIGIGIGLWDRMNDKYKCFVLEEALTKFL